MTGWLAPPTHSAVDEVVQLAERAGALQIPDVSCVFLGHGERIAALEVSGKLAVPLEPPPPGPGNDEHLCPTGASGFELGYCRSARLRMSAHVAAQLVLGEVLRLARCEAQKRIVPTAYDCAGPPVRNTLAHESAKALNHAAIVQAISILLGHVTCCELRERASKLDISADQLVG